MCKQFKPFFRQKVKSFYLLGGGDVCAADGGGIIRQPGGQPSQRGRWHAAGVTDEG